MHVDRQQGPPHKLRCTSKLNNLQCTKGVGHTLSSNEPTHDVIHVERQTVGMYMHVDTSTFHKFECTDVVAYGSLNVQTLLNVQTVVVYTCVFSFS